MNKVKELGQVFTQTNEVSFAISLRQNKGRTLEPSSGNGAFSSRIDCVSIEFDEEIAQPDAMLMDFFDYPVEEKFETVIGNPPYVKGRLINPTTRGKFGRSLITEKGNLYLHFIEKSFHHLTDNGEIIFITPKDFLSSKATEKLMTMMVASGSFTHFYDHTGQPIFTNASPDNVCVWRYQKGVFQDTIETNEGTKNVIINNGRILITSQRLTIPFSDLFYVKVGAVPGQGDKFIGGTTPFVFSKTRQTGNVRMMDYRPDEWIRPITSNDNKKDRIYVNCKTRVDNPFFTHDCKNWDGSVLAIFPKVKIEISRCVQLFNEIDWNELGFVWGGKFSFTQSGLSHLLLPESFNNLLSLYEM
jgi:adenine-specific DNA-methyltransferase